MLVDLFDFTRLWNDFVIIDLILRDILKIIDTIGFDMFDVVNYDAYIFQLLHVTILLIFIFFNEKNISKGFCFQKKKLHE